MIIIGVDGAGWNFMNPLLKKGKLPNFDRLVKEGSSGVLKTINPTKSSVIWTSIATGKSMVKHGIVGWTYVKKNKIEVPFTQTNRRVKAFWNIFSEFGWKVGVINWFVTLPSRGSQRLHGLPGLCHPGAKKTCFRRPSPTRRI